MSMGTDRSITFRFENKDIVIVKANKDGQIKWTNIIPKWQEEEMSSGYTAAYYNGYASALARGGGMPYYSSYINLLKNNKLILILNDNSTATVNPQYGDKIPMLDNFKKSNLYGISIDLATGKMTRKLIATNGAENIFTPRHAFVMNNEVLVPSWQIHLLTRTELKLAKITVE